MKSNVTLKSNIYINKTRKDADPDFIEHIQDYAILKKYYNPSTKLCTAPLTKLQKRLVEQGEPKCSMENGTMSWGVPVGTNHMALRCEQKDCPRYSKCSSDTLFERIYRDFEIVEIKDDASGTTPAAKPVEKKELAKSADKKPIVTASQGNPMSESVEAKPQIKSPQYRPMSKPVAAKPVVAAPQNISTEKHVETRTEANAQNLDIEKLRNATSFLTQDEIINAELKSRIWVNAGPGSGKTYTAIKRLVNIFHANEPDGVVLVLCYSKNAVSVIRSRLTAELGSHIDVLIDKEQLVIRTFDSYASWALDDDLPKGLDYDERISLFLKKLPENPDLLRDVSYFIVDEVQDIVGLRAKMIQMMINYMNCGILLLGDRCQAIYDWSVRKQVGYTSEDFFKWIKKQGFQTGELKGNHRQTEELASICNKMRKSLLFGDETSQEETLIKCKKLLKTISENELPNVLTGKNELILCKTNGLVASISDLLYEGDYIPHYIMQSANHQTLAPWIGKILGGCTEDLISNTLFSSLAQERGIDGVEEKWEALRSLDSHTHSSFLHKKEIFRCLAKMDAIPSICLNHPPDNGVIVSTVHRAKGGEADHVFWLDTPLVFSQQLEIGEKSDALKASYVAVTRAKRDIRLVIPNANKNSLRRLDNGRWIKAKNYNKNGTQKFFCSGIAMRADDANPLSFVPDENAEEVQAFLSELNPGIDMALYPSDNKRSFDIFLDGMQIGFTADQFMKELSDGFRATNHNKNLPVSIESVYISSLVTVIYPENEASENIYRKSGCWLGYELGGFAHINYS